MVENVIYYILYKKMIDIGLKMLVYFRTITLLGNRFGQSVTLMMQTTTHVLLQRYQCHLGEAAIMFTSMIRKCQKIKELSTLRWFDLLTSSYHTQAFSDKDALYSQDWFTKMIKKRWFSLNDYLKRKSAWHPSFKPIACRAKSLWMLSISNLPRKISYYFIRNICDEPNAYKFNLYRSWMLLCFQDCNCRCEIE